MDPLKQFLQANNISNEKWEKANIKWDDLTAIAADYTQKNSELKNSAEYLSNTIQQLPTIHSVRWRLKDVNHLLEKIVRKRADGSAKYLSINDRNYQEVVTDLIGVRAIHLFKDDAPRIDNEILSLWNTIEKPIVYIREGDIVNSHFKSEKFDIKEHPDCYRSIHYVIESTPSKKKFIAELQVRTIFEEGWSEIDHQLRYPNFSNDPYVKSVLTTLNRLSGSADEVAALACSLAETLNEAQSKIAAAEAEKKAYSEKLDKVLGEIEQLKKSQKDQASTDLVTKAHAELIELKSSSPAQIIPTPPSNNGAGALLTTIGIIAVLNAISK